MAVEPRAVPLPEGTHHRVLFVTNEIGHSAPWTAHLPPGTDPRSVDLLAHRSLPGAWTARWAGADPAKPAIHDDIAGWMSVGELEERSRHAAARLEGTGLVSGDKVLLCGTTSTQMVIAYIACLRLGLTVVPVNSAYREPEVAHVVRDARPKAVLVDDPHLRRWAVDAATEPVIEGDTTLPFVDRRSDPEALDRADSLDPALLVYTSGTTGRPKGALLSHGNLLASAEAVRLAWRWEPQDRLVLALPLFHLHGLGVGINGTLVSGASVVLRPSFDVADLASAIDGHSGTMFFGVPTMYQRLVTSGRATALAPLRLCVSGSAPLPADLHRAIARQSRQVVLERYGMSETVMNVSNPYDGERRAGSVGFPLPGVEVRLADETDEILLRGPNVFGGYWQRPDATAEAFVDGWFRSGDVGAFDADGYLQIVGRSKELIISGGFNVYPREVEDALRDHPGVVDAAVVGIAHPDWGEQVVAAIEGDLGDASEATIIEWAAERLAPYKRPKRVVVTDKLPRNAMGKVQKDQVRDLFS